MTFKSILDKIQKELVKKDKVREEIQTSMRKATRLSKQAILFTHQNRFDDAKKLLRQACDLLSRLKKISRKHPDLVYANMVDAAFQEYTEAHVLLGLVEKDQFVAPEEIDVPLVSYVLGVSDVIGELRRRALDSLRSGDVDTSDKCLQIMEYIFAELIAMDDAYLLIPGLRRKCDVARHLIETTRGEVAIETRRKSLESAIKKLEKTIERKTKVEKTS
jgi:translin